MALVILIVLIGGFFVFTDVWTSKLWFDQIEFPQVFTTLLLTQVLLFVGYFAVMTLIVALNMWFALRARPGAARTGQSEILDRYRLMMSRRKWLAIGIPAIILGLFSGVSGPGQAMTWISFVNRQPFGDADPYFGMDSSFYVFEYPLWRQLTGFFMGALIISAIAAAVVYLAAGNLVNVNGNRPSLTDAARTHFSILAALVLVVFGIQCLLDRFGYMISSGTLYTGMQYTDWNSRVVSKLILAVIAFICAALFIVNLFVRRWMIPLSALVIMIVSGIILQLAYPFVIQTFEVQPSEMIKEHDYIDKHIKATRTAYGVDGVELQDYSATSKTEAGQLKDDAEALPGIRLVDPAKVGPTFEQQQQVKDYYSFPSTLDVDRYVIDGTETDSIVAARELNQAGIPDKNWYNLHIKYTHGNGLAAAYGNRREAGGLDWIEKDLPATGKLGEYEGRIYYGEQSNNWVVVGKVSNEDMELDTPTTNNTYEGKGGVPIGNLFNRVLYAAKFADYNLLISQFVGENSKILYDRTPKQRIAEVAPWLTQDQNIYPAVVDGRLVWIVDCYTTSDSFPNSQKVDMYTATADSERSGGYFSGQSVNYIRNSVKAVVDATDGTVSLYAWDDSDPILKTYEAAFPGSLKPKSEISEDMLAHMRYPEDLFKVQREILARYHMTNPRDWYTSPDLWEVPADPVQQSNTALQPPYYLSI
ncbi:MAG: UPF0182 family protein, partial [Propionibacteriaceae bacterium]|nr:UPF0182 family protein [Propionibacteriaceae bacterium]